MLSPTSTPPSPLSLCVPLLVSMNWKLAQRRSPTMSHSTLSTLTRAPSSLSNNRPSSRPTRDEEPFNWDADPECDDAIRSTSLILRYLQHCKRAALSGSLLNGTASSSSSSASLQLQQQTLQLQQQQKLSVALDDRDLIQAYGPITTVLVNGALFGEVALLKPRQLAHRQATVISREACHFLTLSREHFERTMRSMRKLLSPVSEICESLQRLPLFDRIPLVHLKRLSYGMEERVFTRGTPILRQGDPSRAFLVLLDGSVSVSRQLHVTVQATSATSKSPLVGFQPQQSGSTAQSIFCSDKFTGVSTPKSGWPDLPPLLNHISNFSSLPSKSFLYSQQPQHDPDAPILMNLDVNVDVAVHSTSGDLLCLMDCLCLESYSSTMIASSSSVRVLMIPFQPLLPLKSPLQRDAIDAAYRCAQADELRIVPQLAIMLHRPVRNRVTPNQRPNGYVQLKPLKLKRGELYTPNFTPPISQFLMDPPESAVQDPMPSMLGDIELPALPTVHLDPSSASNLSRSASTQSMSRSRSTASLLPLDPRKLNIDDSNPQNFHLSLSPTASTASSTTAAAASPTSASTNRLLLSPTAAKLIADRLPQLHNAALHRSRSKSTSQLETLSRTSHRSAVDLLSIAERTTLHRELAFNPLPIASSSVEPPRFDIKLNARLIDTSVPATAATKISPRTSDEYIPHFQSRLHLQRITVPFLSE